MNLSMKWLSDYVDINVTPREFAEAMTMSGSKVEGYEIESEEITKVVVGKVLSVEKHPDADKLFVCQIDIGQDKPLQIVTGASNVFVGAYVPVATDGSTLPGGIKIKKGKLRGVDSFGMLCSLGELRLTSNDFPGTVENGIMIITEPCEVGADIKEALGINDTVVEFEITSNRPDCMSVIGLAREASATFDIPLKLKAPVVKGSGGDISDNLSVTVLNTELCPRYIARMVKNVKIGPSPRFIRERLRASGVRPINNIVDITNYVMLEYGHPMHAFDLKYVNDNKIVVRNAKVGESIVTLDNIKRELSPEMLVIADGKAPVAVAGIMGGEFSGIMDDTTEVIFESACFEGSSIRTTAKKLGLRTESSARFEKGLNATTPYEAVMRACELVELLGCGEVVDSIIDVDNSKKEPVKIAFDYNWINRFIGIDLSEQQMKDILKKLGFESDNGYITVPYYRTDIEHKADIAEEIARIYGYNKIPTTVISGIADGKLTDKQLFERKINNTLLSLGLSEIITYSFISPKYYDKIRMPSDSPLRDSVTITNPLGEDTSVMRSTTLPSMMEILLRNYNNRNMNVALYELATEYIKNSSDSLPNEYNQITIGMYGEKADFFILKGIIEALLCELDVKDYEVAACTDETAYHPGRCARLIVSGEAAGVFGEIHPIVRQNYGIDTRVYAATIKEDVLFKNADNNKKYQALPKFPAVTRDLSLICDAGLCVGDIEKAIRSAVNKNLLEDVTLFDVYVGEQITSGKKSVSYSITLRSPDHTMTDDEAEGSIRKILKSLESIGAVLRM